jgi:hypothetical protein
MPISNFKARLQDLKIPSSYMREEANSKPARATREAMTLQDPDLERRNPQTRVEIFLGPLDSLNPINLKGVSTHFSSRYFQQHQFSSPQL